MKFFRFLFYASTSLLSNKQVKSFYKKAGIQFGIAICDIYMGECVGFRKRLNRWLRWEDVYSKRGYKTLSIDQFMEHIQTGKNLNLGVKRKANEKLFFHAKFYRENHLGKIAPVIDIHALMQPEAVPQYGVYYPPSTEEQD